jgi:hypothetical protein
VQRQEVRHLDPDGGEALLDELGHGQHRRSGVEAVASLLEHAGPPARIGLALDDHHIVAVAAQMARRRQPTEAGAEHDDAHGVSAPGRR